MFAQITGSEPVGPNQWKYFFEEASINGATAGHAFNLNEVLNNYRGVVHDLLLIPVGTVVNIQEYRINGDVYYSFDLPNPRADIHYTEGGTLISSGNGHFNPETPKEPEPITLEMLLGLVNKVSCISRYRLLLKNDVLTIPEFRLLLERAEESQQKLEKILGRKIILPEGDE